MPVTNFRIEGYDLPGVDNGGKSSDPYFNIYSVNPSCLRDKKIFHSDTIRENLNPIWPMTSFPNNQRYGVSRWTGFIDLIFLGCSNLSSLPAKIIIEVKDWSPMSAWLNVNKLLGESLVLNVEELKDGQEIRLRDENKQLISGHLKIFFPQLADVRLRSNTESAEKSGPVNAAAPTTSRDSFNSADNVPDMSLVVVVGAKIGYEVGGALAEVLEVAIDIGIPGVSRMLSGLKEVYKSVHKYRETSNEAAELLVFCASTAKTLEALRSVPAGQISQDLGEKLESAGEAIESLRDTLTKIRSRTKFEVFFMQQQYAIAASSAKQKTEDALDELMRSAQIEALVDGKQIKSSIQRLLIQSKSLMQGVEDQMREMERQIVKACREESNQLKKMLQEMKEQMQDLIDSLKQHNLKDLLQQEKLIQGFVAKVSSVPRKLIISTGDISDVDGFLAVAEYSKTGADMLFVMNYPGYIGNDIAEDEVEDYASRNPGKGYKYTANKVLASVKDPSQKYQDYMGQKPDTQKAAAYRMKKALTDAGFHITMRVWNDLPCEKRGKCYFCIGGVNDINPFSCNAIRNDVATYVDSFGESIKSIEPTEGTIYDEDGSPYHLEWERYDQIYMDFNGSMAFFTSDWQKLLFAEATAKKIKGVFVMGGVYDDVVPMTMPAIPTILNRFSSATMNQLYHPLRAGQFFKVLSRNKHIPVFIISNNVVGDVTSFDPSDADKPLREQTRTFDGVEKFLQSNGLDGPFVRTIAKCHYLGNNPPGNHRPFDFYTALALTTFMKEIDCKAAGSDADINLSLTPTRNLFFDDSAGLTFVSNRDSWNEVIDSYMSVMKIACEDEKKRDAFKQEIKYMKYTRPTEHKGRILEVKSLQFGLDEDTKKVTLESLQRELVE